MGKGRAPDALETYLIKKREREHKTDNSFFVSLGDTHEERVENYVKWLDEKIKKERNMK